MDDMIATGGTMTEACTAIAEKGANTVVAAAVHGLFLEDGVNRVTAAADTVYTTDTVPPAAAVDTVSVHPVLDTVFIGEHGNT
jgi:ribose-phosphate pyrophosphokinase